MNITIFAGATFMVADACRAAHIHGFGSFGTGFLYDPDAAKAKMKAAGLRFVSVDGLLGRAPIQRQPSPRLGAAFPASLPPFGLEAVRCSIGLPAVKAGESPRYSLAVDEFPLSVLGHLLSHAGELSPLAPLPARWPGAPSEAVSLSWAYPLTRRSVGTAAALGVTMATNVPSRHMASGLSRSGEGRGDLLSSRKEWGGRR